MLLRRLEDCDEFIAGDLTRLREILHPDKLELISITVLPMLLFHPGAHLSLITSIHQRYIIFYLAKGLCT